ncbi:glycosyltransferase family 4 protein [Metabacillus indicus]|uniref:glycosyltransferase family 4 protein n=1 Tax=Metabacillus indicus TaxID=246786 RepID=UPI00049326DC|nr:glycosyltransferase family 4 protein [Metabacillus indicus]KEZ50337.1 glycosyl transferase [Metabacillus indicus LMG 22858]
MKPKILFTATVDYHFKSFHLPVLKWFQENGWEVHVAAHGTIDLPYTDFKFNLPIKRSPFNRRNTDAYRQLKEIIDHNHYSIIHCHTPVGGVLTRLAARDARKKGTKVLYTAHGFHFCKGASLQNWLTYYPVEKWLSSYTDCLLTINNEDYHLALKHRFKAGSIEHIHGVGVDTEKFCPIPKEDKVQRRKLYGYQKDDLLMFYAAEFNKNKNQMLLLKAMIHLRTKLPNAKLLLAGEGTLLTECKRFAEANGLKDTVHFLGFRNDIANILPMCDLAVASSLREGLPVNIMEAMACGLPIVATDNRGHRELVGDGVNGFIIHDQNSIAFSEKVAEITTFNALREQFGDMSRLRLIKYETASVIHELESIYNKYMQREENEAENQYNRAYI